MLTSCSGRSRINVVPLLMLYASQGADFIKRVESVYFSKLKENNILKSDKNNLLQMSPPWVK